MKVLNNHVLVDIGHYGSYFSEAKLGGTNFHFDTTYAGYSYLRRSGKVVEAPKEFTYAIPLTMEHKLVKPPLVKKGDTVFFSDKVFNYCKDNQLIFKEGETTLYLIPYRLLICSIEMETGKVQMLNGKVLIKMRDDVREIHKVLNTENTKLYIPEQQRGDAVYRFAEITHVDNNEGYQGFAYDVAGFESFNYKKQDLKVGDIIAINKFSDFDLQSIFQEVAEHDELKKSFVVDRASIVCHSRNGKVFDPYGFYFTIKPEKRKETNPCNDFVTPKAEKLKTRYGRVEKTGCAVPLIAPNDKVRIHEKADFAIDGKEYIHKFWVILKMEE